MRTNDDDEMQMQIAAGLWRVTRGLGMTGEELELARALFQLNRNSREVARINELLRVQLLQRLGLIEE